MLAQKGADGAAEAQGADTAMKLLGGKLEQVIPVTLPGIPTPRTLVVVEKVSATPVEYPRSVGTPLKQPLGLRSPAEG